MKIIIASESYYPTVSGVAVFSRYLAHGLAKRGHQVHVICPSTNFSNYDETEGDVQIHRLRAVRNPFRPKLKVSFFPNRGVADLMRQIEPDVVHMQDPTSICSEVLKMSEKMAVPTVITNHFAFDYVLSYLPWLKPLHPLIAKNLERYLLGIYNRCDFITFPSATIAQQFANLKLRTPSMAISNGVNLEQFFPSYNYQTMKQRFAIPNKPIVLHVGRLDQDKRSDQVIKAFIELHQSHDAFLLVCGEGNMKEKLIDLIKRANLEKRVRFIGFINHQTELPEIYQMASVFITASTIETQGIVALEAMASGLPLVVPNAGALPELVKNGENGYLFSPDDPLDLAGKTAKILNDPALAKKMGERSLEMVETHQIEKSFDHFEKIYLRLIKENNRVL